MRWQGQELGVPDAAALPGLEHLNGLVRSVTTPEFSGVTFHEVMAKSALNHVPGASAMPFDWTVNPYRGCSHACVYCMAPETLVLCADGRQRRMDGLAIGQEIIGSEAVGEYRRYVRTRVLAKWTTHKRAHRITLADGTVLTASGDHRFLTDRGWKHVTGAMSGDGRRPFLTTSNRLQGFGLGGRPALGVSGSGEYRRGYLSGMIRGDGMLFHRTYDDGARSRTLHRFRLALADSEALDRTRRMLLDEGVATHTRPFTTATDTRRAMTAIHSARRTDVETIERLIGVPSLRTRTWQAGFLAGVFDAEGSHSRGILRISNKDPEVLQLIADALTVHDLPYVIEPPRPNGVRAVRVTGGLPERQRFFRITEPAITRKLAIEGMAVKTVADLRIVSIEDLGVESDMVDITTGTGDFIANGVISHNCFARGTHEYLEFDTGHDFDSQIVVKINVAEVLRKELARGSWTREPVALGTNTDPYQRAEGRYRLMPGIVSALADSGTPFSILTKGTLLRRDLPLLQEAAASVPVTIATSIAVFDDTLQKLVEPGTPSTAARLETVRAATEAGFRVTVFLMPILPHLTDSIAALDDALRRIREAGAARVVYGALHLRPGVKPWFMQWLGREHPELVSSYLGLYPGVSSYAPKGYRTWLAKRVRPLLRVHGLGGQAEDDSPPRGAVPGLAARSQIVTTSRGRAAAGQAAPAMLF
ncbi:intein-containing Rv2578c family radical SAM protein [Microbacterium sp. SS28]|uniref:intein-containing Rv2578c family radical SAM protein n=1 Tax=Microbacterium sp. SS28 TaxID=2919948 RepID=UPI001FA96A68|nr:intein-containing Rv2578c family radical SAM protein [Microbacterium sp. SS28]